MLAVRLDWQLTGGAGKPAATELLNGCGLMAIYSRATFTLLESDLMMSETDILNQPEPASPIDTANRFPFVSFLLLTAWCGLLAGLLEVGTIVVRKQTVDPDHLYGMTRHFVWLIPTADLCIFLIVGSVGWIVRWLWPPRGRWLVTRALCTLTVLPAVLVAFPKIYSPALALVALGVSARLVPLVERNHRAFRRLVLLSFPAAVGLVVIAGAALWVGDRRQQARADAQPQPPPGSPNVLLIVLDTVAANHLGLHGYNRQTSLTLTELAERGIRFDSARAPSSWSLPTHATIFTGRWLHELSAGWLTPLDDTHPTLAEFLGSRGYATAGFVGNTKYCAADSGLKRGFVHYDDFIFPKLTAFKSAVLVHRLGNEIETNIELLENRWELNHWRPYTEWLWRKLDFDRKDAAVVNREFLDWLSRRQQPERPFFAFLNYFDAHHPYELPAGRMRRFGFEPTNSRQRYLLHEWFLLSKSSPSPPEIAFAVAAYDDCIADLDEQVGRLIDELEMRGVLKHTWVIVTSDHGESFGEHSDIFCHGTSLYQTELHVPLLVIPPGGATTKRVVKETVTLRDVAATIVDMAGQEGASPFPGKSLARYWDGPSPAAPIQHAAADPALAELALPNVEPSRDSSLFPKSSWPQGGLLEGGWSYIRQEGVLREELFHLSEDANEQHNLAGTPTAEPTLTRMRETLGRITGGPLVPTRFSP
jgi:arylsulfatase A-like enzyme